MAGGSELERAFKLCQLAGELEDPQGRFLDATKAYQRALLLVPDEAFINASFASFCVRCRLRDIAQDEELLQRVRASCLASVAGISELDEAIHSSVFNICGIFFGRVLHEFQEATGYFERGLQCEDNNTDILYNYATVLDQSMKNHEKAAELYRKVLLLDDKHCMTLHNYAALLVDAAKNGTEESLKQQKFNEAAELFERANSMQPGLPAFNLACIASLQGKKEKAKQWLDEAFQHGLIECGAQGFELLTQDPDLAGVKDEPWFAEFCAKVKGPKQNKSDYAISFCGRSIELFEAELQGQVDKVAGTTGWTIWPSSYVVLRYLEERVDREWFHGKRILDLSGGLGLVGIGCAILGAEVVISEIGSKQLDSVNRNIKCNGCGSNTVSQSLAWGDDRSLRSIGAFDLVLATDLLYIAFRDSLQQELSATLIGLVQSGTSHVLLTFEERLPAEEKAFLEALSAHVDVTKHNNSDINVKDLRSETYNPEGEVFGIQRMLQEEPMIQMWTLKPR